MKFTILFGQAFRVATVSEPPGGSHMPTVVKAFQERYEFVQVPRNLEEFNLVKGITFSHGIFKEKKVVIDGLSIYQNAIFVNTHASTDDADLFLDGLIEWVNINNYASISVGIPERRRYNSQLEFIMTQPFESFFPSSPILEFIGKQVTGLLHGQGRETKPFQLSGFSVHCDPTTQDPPLAFTFERRLNKPWSSNLFFSAAPLRTEEHKELIEKIVATASKK